MGISDSHFIALSLGITTSTGVVVAILVSVANQLTTTITTESSGALQQIHSSADKLYQLFLTRVGQTRDYFVGVSNFPEASKVITAMAVAQSVDAVSDFFQWRVRTNPISAKFQAFNDQNRQTLGGGLEEYHARLGQGMFELDQAVQRKQNVVILQSDLRQLFRLVLGVMSVLFLSLIAIFMAATEVNDGVGDGWNVLVAALLLGAFGVTLFFTSFYIRRVQVPASTRLANQISKLPTSQSKTAI